MKHCAIPMLVLLALLAVPQAGQAQSHYAMTNMARDFWVMFLPNMRTHISPVDECSLVITGPDDAQVTVASGEDTVTMAFSGGGLLNHLCGTNAAVRGRAYHVTSTADIALYARNATSTSHDVAMIIPTRCLGTKYIAQSAAAAQGDTEMLGIIATEDSTVVTVHLVNPNGVPIPPDDLDAPADGLLHIPLQRGEAYIVGTQQHRTFGAFSGMEVTSNGRPFALFQGNSAAHVPTADEYYGGHLYEQAVPYSQWGRHHLVGCVGEQQSIYYLMTSADDDNTVYFNASSPTGPAGPVMDRLHSQTYQMQPHPYNAASIATTGRMGLTLLLTSYGASGFCGGPSSAMLPSVEHGVQRAWFTAQQFDPYQENHLVIFCDTAFVRGLRLDGVPISDSSTWDYLRVQAYRTTVGIGAHRLEADSGTFVAFLYGLRDGYHDSYANPVGMALDPYPRDTLVRTDTTCSYEAYRWGPFRWAEGALADTGTLHLERMVYDPDSIHLYRLTLHVLPAYRSEEHVTLVPGQSLAVEDTLLSTPGTYTFHYPTTTGCDSVRVVVLDHCTAPAPCIAAERPFVDREYPVVQLTDCTPGEHSAEWHFADGDVFRSASVRRHLRGPLGDSVEVRLRVCDSVGCCADSLLALPVVTRSVWFPNAFTPGAEEANSFGCVTSVEASQFSLEVYDRRGLLVFSTDRADSRWDGNRQGRPCPQGAYVYHWFITDAYGFRQSGTGTVTLLR